MQQHIHLAVEQEAALLQLRALYGLDRNTCLRRFRAYCRTQLHDWQTCYQFCQNLGSVGAEWMRGEHDTELETGEGKPQSST